MIYLVVGTILLAVIIIVLLINNVRDKVRLITLVICLVTLTLSVVSSYEILFQPFDPGQLRPLSLLNPQLIFFFNVLVKFLIFYWLVAIATGIINPERIAKYGAKLLGVMYSESARKAEIEDNAIKADRQMDLIVELNRNIFDFLLKPSKKASSTLEIRSDLIRAIVKDILVKSYANHPAVNLMSFLYTKEASKP